METAAWRTSGPEGCCSTSSRSARSGTARPGRSPRPTSSRSPPSPATTTRCTPTRSSPRRRSSAGGSSTVPGVFAIATGLESRLGIKEGTAIAFLGMTWSLKAAVKLGDTIHVHERVAAVRTTSKPDRGHRHLRRRRAQPAGRGVPGRPVARDVPPGAAVVTATTFDGRLAEQARQRPDAPAVLFGGETCTYAELDQPGARASPGAARRRRRRPGRPGGPRGRQLGRPPRRGLRGVAGRRRARHHLPVVDGGRAGLRHRAAPSRRPSSPGPGWRGRSGAAAGAVGRWPSSTAPGRSPGLPAGRPRGRRTRLRPSTPMRWRSSASRPARPPARRRSCTRHAGLLGAAAAYATCLAPRARRRHPGLPADGLGLRPGDDVDGRAARRWPGGRAGPGRARGDARGDGRRTACTFFAGVTTMFGKLVQHLDDRDGPRPICRGCGCASPAASRGTRPPSRGGSELTGCPVHDVYAASECFPVVTYDPLRGSAAPAGQRRPGRRRGCAAAGRPGRARTCRPARPARRGPAARPSWSATGATPTSPEQVLTPDGWYRTGDLARVDDDGLRARRRAGARP